MPTNDKLCPLCRKKRAWGNDYICWACRLATPYCPNLKKEATMKIGEYEVVVIDGDTVKVD